MSVRSKLRLPREHGAWAMLYVPFVLGLAVAGKINGPAILLLLAVTALFISRESMLLWWRAKTRGREDAGAARMFWLYLSIGILCGAPLILVWRLYVLLLPALVGGALLLVNGKQAMEMEDRSVGGEILAIAGLTLTAPASYTAARGVWDRTAFALWGLSFLYFASSVFYIKLRIHRLNPRKQAQQQRASRECAIYHSFLLLALAALFYSGSLPLFGLIAFAPILARSFWSLLKPVREVNLKRAGMIEIAYSLIFLLCIAMGFRA